MQIGDHVELIQLKCGDVFSIPNDDMEKGIPYAVIENIGIFNDFDKPICLNSINLLDFCAVEIDDQMTVVYLGNSLEFYANLLTYFMKAEEKKNGNEF